jgi:MFS family permease
VSADAPAGGRSLGRALRHRNYRLFFGGQAISLVGTWMTRVATGWLVYRLTDSAWMLGVVGFAGQIPTFALAPFAGVMIDRWDRHRVLVVTQALAMLQSALLAAFTLSGTIEIAHVLALSLFQGIINALDMPARQTFVVEMIEDREDLPNAIALNSTIVNAARLLGPSVAGLVIAAFGAGLCFLADALSYLPVLASLLAMRLAPRAARREPGPMWSELRDGFRYATGFAPIRALLLLLALASLVGMPYSVLMPAIAEETLHGGAHTLGFLMSAAGLGALGGALYLATRRSVLGLGRVTAVAAFAFGAGLVAFSRSGSLALSLLLLVPVGAGMMVLLAATNTLLQTLVDEDMRGRVMSFYAMALFGTVPFGSLLAGGLAHRIGTPDTLLVGGLACIAGALLFLRKLPELRRAVHPVYVSRGILPAVDPDAGAS